MNVVGVIGVGMIGGSIALRARRNGARVLGFDADARACERAVRCGAIDAIASFDEVVRESTTVVVAAHVEPTLALLRQLREHGPRAQLILDVGSIKAPVVEAARGLRAFVATHPMAGSERSGVDAARADLFDGRTWAYVSSGDDALDARARDFIASMGALAVPVDAVEHDRIVARTSHLPQIVGWCFARSLEQRTETIDALCGPVARELLRVGRSETTMWRDILRGNAVNVERELRELARALEREADELHASGACG
jgi:prephenate dehydrogenase